jgi:hypothetical protein
MAVLYDIRAAQTELIAIMRETGNVETRLLDLVEDLDRIAVAVIMGAL